jgi:hypothetical protein
MSRNIHFITYGNSKFARAKARILKEAEEFGEFKTVKGYGPEDLPNDFKEQFKQILSQPRIGGYGIWRPMIIKERLDSINDGDFLIYVDAGCTLNPQGKTRLYEYINALGKSDYGILSFQMTGTHGPGGFHAERLWTTKQIFNYFNINMDSEMAKNGQYLDTVIIMEKNNHMKKILDIWIKSIYDNALMFTDIYNSDQAPYFKDNRHEQSVLSLIRKKYGSMVIEGDETWMQPFGQGESLKYPFWATRSKK